MVSPSRYIPAVPGTYALVLRLSAQRRLRIGRLGLLTFSPGWYAYVGSAFGPGGLAARLGRHLRLSKKPHWHIDHLRAAARVAGMWLAPDSKRREHLWAGMLADAPFNGRPIAGFGASDCRCGSHLFHFPRPPEPERAAGRLSAGWIPFGPVGEKRSIQHERPKSQ